VWNLLLEEVALEPRNEPAGKSLGSLVLAMFRCVGGEDLGGGGVIAAPNEERQWQRDENVNRVVKLAHEQRADAADGENPHYQLNRSDVHLLLNIIDNKKKKHYALSIKVV